MTLPDSEFIPTEAEQIQASEAYIRYLLGTTMLHDPHRMRVVHNLDPTDSAGCRLILLYAETLMLNGLKGVIRFSQPASDDGTRPLSPLEQKFDRALPNMQATVARTYETENERLTLLNSGLDLLRPAPMTDRVIYNYICHGRLDHIRTLRLMDLLLPASEFTPLLSQRTLGYQANVEHEVPGLTLVSNDDI